jgi:predicted phage terminase large subunit-like protein
LLPEQVRREAILGLSEDEAVQILYSWACWAREAQLPPPGDWRVWLLKAGRGYGKTRAGGEWIRSQVEKRICGRLALIGPTAADARDVMVEGESGLLAIAPPWCRPKYEPSKRRLTWPNGAMATTYSADEPERLRGPQHDGFWADEVGAWRYPEAWDMLMFGLRLGRNPRGVVTTTPRPNKLVKDLIKLPTTIVTGGSTYENRAYLPASFFSQIIARYEGTRLGRQEINGELLEDNPGALWTLTQIDNLRVKAAPTFKRIVVAIDPAVTNTEDSDETGIIVAGLGDDNHGYVLDDLTVSASPDAWGRRAILAFIDHAADRIVAEVNNGGDLVENVIRMVAKDMGETISYKAVRASRGKAVRAEPVAALYEQGRIHHVGTFPRLEDQMCEYDPITSTKSPDRMDALVWAFTELMIEGKSSQGLFDFYAQEAAALQEQQKAMNQGRIQ